MRPANDQPGTDQTTGQTTDQRVSVSEAAALLGLSEDAVRSRLKRGTLRKDKAKDGTVRVVLGEGQPADRPMNNNDRPTTDQATGQTGSRGEAQEELVESLIDQLAYMREQLAEEREARRRADTIIAQLTHANATLAQRVPELEAATEQRDSSVTVTEEGGVGATDLVLRYVVRCCHVDVRVPGFGTRLKLR
jgi:predicted ArsR family transcriptional regulator